MSVFNAARVKITCWQNFLCSTTAITGAVAVFHFNQGSKSSHAQDITSRGRCHLLALNLRCAHDNSNFSFSGVSSDYSIRNQHTRNGVKEKPNVNNPTPVMLAGSPVSSNTNDDCRVQNRHRWWILQRWAHESTHDSDKNKKSTWLQILGKTFFVVVRVSEIVLRLSPLLILTPTAVMISSVDALFKRIWDPKNSIILSTSGGFNTVDDNDLFVKKFRDFPVSSRKIRYHGQTWASNLAWRYTLYTLQSLGPAFSKLGQWAATRRDLFPLHVCNRLSELHDMACTHSWEFTHNALIQAFGEYEAKGLTLSTDIIGSGSAAQVHKGTLTLSLHNNGTNQTNGPELTKTVAIKVLHPNTSLLIERDLALMQHIADFIDQCIPLEAIRMLSLPRAVANFSDIMRRQVDLRIEGENLRTFRSNFACSNSIDFPQPAEGFVTEHVLVEDHVNAKPISSYLADDTSDGLEVRKKLAAPLLRAFLKMVFIDNFVHADLHPGNVLVQKESDQKEMYTIVFVDAGIAMSLKPNDQQNLLDLFKAVVLNEGYTAGEMMVERARYERCSSIAGGKHAFASGIAEIVSEFHDRSKQGLTLGAVRVGSLLGRVLDLCRRYRVEIDPAMASVVVSMLVLEGLGRSLDPELNLMNAAIPFILGRGKM